MKYFYVYVIKSLKDNKNYVGFTGDLKRRIDEHNSGNVPSTKNRIPFELVYWEGCRNQKDATKREKYLKSSWGKRYIKNRIQNYLTG
ncbi:MAG: GIY-YIG nuclease family protein [Melioribacteraceae bacterium]